MAKWRSLWILAGALIAGAAFGQPWPAKPIQVIVPFPPGSVDAKVRIVIERVGKILGQPLVMINKPGAGMRIGTEQMLRSAPDGYTIGVAVQANTWISPEIDPSASYSAKDMTMLGMSFESPMVLVANPKSAIRSVDDLLRTARTQPGKLNYAGPTGGSMFRISFEVLKTRTGINLTFVPYRGLALALQDIAGGQVDVGFADSGSIPLIKADRLRALAVAAPKRLRTLPEVPTFAELGIDFESQPWLGFSAPLGLPPAVERRLVEAFAEALRSPDVRSALESSGETTVLTDTSPAAMRARIQRELAEFRANVKPGTINIE